MKKLLPAVAVALLAVPAAAQVNGHLWQSSSGYSFNNPASALAGTMLHNQIYANMMNAAIAKQRGNAAPSGVAVPKSAPRAGPGATDFKPALPRYSVADATAEQQTKDPKQQAAYKQLFHMFVDAAENADGFRKNNVAYALSYVVLASLQIATGKEIPDADSEAFAQQMNEAMASSGVLKKMSPADQQRFYEGCLVMGGLVVGSWAEASKSGDEKQKENVRQMAKQVLASFGVK